MRCAYCHDEIAETAGICSGCDTRLHPECWDEAEACPTLGCQRKRLRFPANLWLVLTLLSGAFMVFVEEFEPRPQIVYVDGWNTSYSAPPTTRVLAYRPTVPTLAPDPWERWLGQGRNWYGERIIPRPLRIERGPRRRLMA
ncbi:MAG: hypothetical protein JKY65_31035 [Planctomycetes bacterium]|nr:hypothetical protein [Planctomycetota bacterium]